MQARQQSPDNSEPPVQKIICLNQESGSILIKVKHSNWQFPQKTDISIVNGVIDLAHLPNNTKLVKLHVFIQTGTCNGDDTTSIYFRTKNDIAKFSVHPYHQNAWSYTNENLVLELDESKTITVDQLKIKGNASLSVELLAYKAW